MAYAEIVETTNAAADRNPCQHGQGTLRQTLGKRASGVESFGDDATGVGHALVLVPGSQRRRHRQSGPMQPISQLPFGKRTRLLLTLPKVTIFRDRGRQTSTAVVAQHEPATA